MIEGENFGASFTTVREACRLADAKHEAVHIVVLGKDLVIQPDTDPHRLYRETFPDLHSKR